MEGYDAATASSNSVGLHVLGAFQSGVFLSSISPSKAEASPHTSEIT